MGPDTKPWSLDEAANTIIKASVMIQERADEADHTFMQRAEIGLDIDAAEFFPVEAYGPPYREAILREAVAVGSQ